MGQYYMPIIGDQHGLNCQVFDRSVDDEFTFAKLMEHSWWGSDFVNAFAALLFNEKKRVCWVGDYASEPDDFHFHINSAAHTPTYKEVWGRNVKPISISRSDFSLDHKFLVNFDTHEFINLDEYKEDSMSKDGWVIHPLPLLTAVGNDRGSGDFHDWNVGYENVGMWAWHLISITDSPPNCFFNKINVVFKEVD